MTILNLEMSPWYIRKLLCASTNVSLLENNRNTIYLQVLLGRLCIMNALYLCYLLIFSWMLPSLSIFLPKMLFLELDKSHSNWMTKMIQVSDFIFSNINVKCVTEVYAWPSLLNPVYISNPPHSFLNNSSLAIETMSQNPTAHCSQYQFNSTIKLQMIFMRGRDGNSNSFIKNNHTRVIKKGKYLLFYIKEGSQTGIHPNCSTEKLPNRKWTEFCSCIIFTHQYKPGSKRPGL